MKGLQVGCGGCDSAGAEHAIQNVLADRIRSVTAQAAAHANQFLEVHGQTFLACPVRSKLRHSSAEVRSPNANRSPDVPLLGRLGLRVCPLSQHRSEEHTSELQSP